MARKQLKVPVWLVAVPVLVGTIGIVLFLFPTSWHIRRSITISTAPQSIHPYLNDLKNWQKWAKRPDADPSSKYIFKGAEEGVGAEMNWKGTTDWGKMIITKSDPAKGLWYEMTDLQRNSFVEGSLTYTTNGKETQVDWEAKGKVGPFSGFMVPFIKDRTSDYFDYAFLQLKYLVETSTTIEWHAKRSMEIDTTKEAIYPLLNNLKEWESWTKLAELNPTSKYTFSGPAAGNGAKMQWSGGQNWGYLQITKSDPSKGISFETAYHSNSVNIHSSITYTSKESGLQVTWESTGFLNSAHSNTIKAIEKSMSDYYHYALLNLKNFLEKPVDTKS